MVQQLKEKYNSAMTTSERLSVLTVLPKSWSLHKTAKVFGISRYYFARRAKQLVAEKGVLSNPNPKAGKTLLHKQKKLRTSIWQIIYAGSCLEKGLRFCDSS